jgi:hypothetical protein
LPRSVDCPRLLFAQAYYLPRSIDCLSLLFVIPAGNLLLPSFLPLPLYLHSELAWGFSPTNRMRKTEGL